MARRLRVLGAGYDERHAQVFLSIDQTGLAHPNSHVPLTRIDTLRLIRGLTAALQQDEERGTR